MSRSPTNLTAAGGGYLTARFQCLFLSGLVLFCAQNSLVRAQNTDVLTYHNDNARTGQTLHEEVLTPFSVNATNFGRLRFLNTDGMVDAQPLYVAGVKIPGFGSRNVLYVGTEMDTVYAFDADRTNLYWQTSLGATHEGPAYQPMNCGQVAPYMGITATPVIDREAGSNGTIFVVAMTTDGTHIFQKLHALDLASGAERLPWTLITASYPGTGDNSDGTNVVFDPARYKERCGLLLLNGVIYTAWASHCDIRPYTGWVIGYDERTLAQTSVLNITPNGSGGGIWMSGDGLAADASGNIYFLAGNGTLDTNLTADGFPSLGDYGNGFIKLSTTNRSLAVMDYFASYATSAQNAKDLDLGSGGAMVLPDMVDTQGNVRQLAIGAGKDANIYIVDRLNMGKFNPTSDAAIYQKLSGAVSNAAFSTPALFNGTIYYGGLGASLKAFPFQEARLQPVVSQTAHVFPYPGTTPAVSANGTNNGLVWAIDGGYAYSTWARLLAYPATNLGVELFNNTVLPAPGNKFITPTIASGRVYVGVTYGVGVFGLLSQSTLTPIQKWRDDHFGNPSNVGAGANGATPADDSVPNLVKYALGLDPFMPTNTSGLVTGAMQETNGQVYAALTVDRAARPPDVSYIVEVSSDLQNWVSGPDVTTNLVDTPTQLTVLDEAPLGPAPCFLRLRVSP